MQRSACLPQGALLPYELLRGRNSLSNAAAEQLHAFVALPAPLCPKPRGGLGEEKQAALMEGMLGQLGERLFFQALSPEVCSNLGVRREAKGKGTLASPVLQQFLRASLDTIKDEAWIEALSCELSRWQLWRKGGLPLALARGSAAGAQLGLELWLVLCPPGLLMLLAWSVPPREPFPAVWLEAG